MIQRIQTIYLLLAIIALIVFLCIPESAAIIINTTETLRLPVNAIAITNTAPTGESQPLENSWVLGIAVFLSIALRLAAILTFKNRKLQTRCCLWAIATDILWCVLLAIFGYQVIGTIESATHTDASPTLDLNWGLAMLPIAICFTIMAVRGIRHDEKLVRAADRLR